MLPQGCKEVSKGAKISNRYNQVPHKTVKKTVYFFYHMSARVGMGLVFPVSFNEKKTFIIFIAKGRSVISAFSGQIQLRFTL